MTISASTRTLFFFLLICASLHPDAGAQRFRYSIPGLDSLETFIVGGGSSAILQSGQAEVISNNSLSSFWVTLHENGRNSPVLDRLRQTQFASDLFAFYGISRSGRWDVGIQLKYIRTRLDNAAGSSMFKVFESGSRAEDNLSNAPPNAIVADRSFGGLAYAGVRFRYKPFDSRPELIVNGGYALATVKDPVGQTQLNANRDMADLGVTYYKEINRNIFYFFGASASAFFPSSVQREYLYNANVNFFIIHRTNNRKLTFYPGMAYGLSFKPSKFNDRPLIRTVDFLFAYGGVQYAPNSKFNVFATGGFPLLIDLKTPSQQIVRESYSILALGFRNGF